MRGKRLVLMFAIVFLSCGVAVTFAQLGSTVLAAAPVAGSYQLSCFMSFPLTPCLPGNEIPVGTSLVLVANVEDSAGTPATSGSVIFQECLLRGAPAATVACASGRGTWSHVSTRVIEPNGITGINYGFVSTPNTTIGFRFRYIGQGSGIANGTSNTIDVTWVPAE